MKQKDEPILDVAHLGHVELLTPRPQESLEFFTEVYGLDEVSLGGPTALFLVESGRVERGEWTPDSFGLPGVRAASGSIEDETEEVSPDANHMAETASVTLDREIDYTLEENSEHVLSAIETALAKIEDGSFGICETCGQPISEERLAAMPWVTQCIDCKRREERG